jgi:type II secretory pathway component PulK
MRTTLPNSPRTSDFGLRTSHRRGIALLIVMISIFVLTMLALAFAYSMRVETRLAFNSNNEAELEWLGRSGVEYCRWVLAMSLMDPTKPYDSADQPWATGSGFLGPTNNPIGEVQKTIELGPGASFTWSITDLERKFNVNSSNEELLQQALTHIGLDAGETAPIVGSILNWTAYGNSTRHLQGANPEYYQSLDPPYDAKNGPIDDITELLLIRGVTPDLYWGGVVTNHNRAAFRQRGNNRFGFGPEEPEAPPFTAGLVDLFTPVSSGRINLNTCSAQVLEIIPPGIDPLIAAAIVGARGGEDDGTGLTGPYRNVDQVRRVPEVTPIVSCQIAQFCDVRSRTFEVHVDATVAGYTRYFTAILGRNSVRDVQVLSFYWSDRDENKQRH